MTSRFDGIATHYELLGVPSDASAAQIHAAYRGLARRAHPDAGPGADDRTMAGLNEAWRVLRDPARRAAYDLSLRAPGLASGPEDDVDESEELVHTAPRAGRSLLGLPWLVVLGALALIFVFTAYAASGGGSRSEGSDGVVKAGSCVQVDRGVAREISCDDDHVGVVDRLVPLGGECPDDTAVLADPGGTSTLCVRLR